MGLTSTDIDAARDLFSGLDQPVTARRMFGGAGLYAGGQLFGALHSDGRIYLKAKGALADRLAACGARRFEWQRPSDGRRMAMPHWSLPEAALDDPEAACDWARAALAEGD